MNYVEHREQLKELTARLRQQLPGPLTKFGQLHGEAMKAGALDAKQKELIALGISIAMRCDGCIAFHVHEAMETGASIAEIAECIGVAIMMGGGPSALYGAQAWEAVEQFQALRE
jgi:AhpD family alkylhydroperoxidase